SLLDLLPSIYVNVFCDVSGRSSIVFIFIFCFYDSSTSGIYPLSLHDALPISDTAEVATVEEFYRARFLYRLTAPGEATERALAVFEEGIRRLGELQTAALGDIRDLLHELRDHAARDEAGAPDAGKVHRTLRELWSRFDELTERAQVFIGSIQRTVDLHGIDLDALLSYKDALINYLERFLSELVVAQAHTAALLRDI